MTPPEQGPLPPTVIAAIDAFEEAVAEMADWDGRRDDWPSIPEEEEEQMEEAVPAARKALEQAIREALAPAQPAGDQEAAHRAWALERVRRREEPKCSKHGDDLIVGTEAGCPECWRILGRREGQMEAGAYYTLDEAMAMLRLGAPTDSGGSATSTDGNPAANALSVSPTPEQKDGTP